MTYSLYLKDGGDLVVTSDEFFAIKELQYKCEGYFENDFDDKKWIQGLRFILGPRMPKLYSEVKLIVDWSL